MDVNVIKNGNLIELTETENELYDRQIRLWGLESQKRLRTAKILISGLNGLGAEITKNIILTGVNSVTLRDDAAVTEEDFCSQFLVPRESLDENRAEASLARARALNPMVEISADTEPLADKKADYFIKFDVVVIIGENNDELQRIDTICRDHNIKFFGADVWGMFGYYFVDLQIHQFVEEEVKHNIVSKPNEPKKMETISAKVHRELEYPDFSALTEFDLSAPKLQRKLKRKGPGIILLRILQTFRETQKRDPSYKTREADISELQMIHSTYFKPFNLYKDAFEPLFAQISPAVAVVGGVVAQEIIKAVTKVGAPYCNVFIFDPQTCCGYVESVGVS